MIIVGTKPLPFMAELCATNNPNFRKELAPLFPKNTPVTIMRGSFLLLHDLEIKITDQKSNSDMTIHFTTKSVVFIEKKQTGIFAQVINGTPAFYNKPHGIKKTKVESDTTVLPIVHPMVHLFKGS